MNTGTVLDDQRIADLRGRVMADVDADVRKRSRRARLVAGGAAATIVVAGLGVGLSSLTSDPSPATDLSSAPAPDSGFSGATEEGPSEVAPIPEQQAIEPDASSPDRGNGGVADPTQDSDRSVVTTGWVEITVDDPTEGASRFGTWVESMGGRIDQRSDQDGQTQMTVRVPADQVAAAIEQLRTYGEVEATSISNVDVTAQVVDLDARIAALQASVARLTEILSTATTTGEVVEAETNLTQRQAELDGLVAQRTALGDQVDLSTIDVTFDATESAATVEPDGFLGGLKTGWNSLVETVNGTVTAAGVAVPWLAILVALGAVAWVATRRRRRS